MRYVAADLLDLPQQWLGAYDLVVAIITVQARDGRPSIGGVPSSTPRPGGGVGQQLGQGVTPVGGQER